MKQYVGIPYSEQQCWDLCRTVYAEQYHIQLPLCGEPAPLFMEYLDGPVEGCLVHVIRVPPLAEHWGVYSAGHVLHAQHPSSIMVPLSRFMQNHAQVQFIKVTPL